MMYVSNLEFRLLEEKKMVLIAKEIDVQKKIAYEIKNLEYN